MAKSIEHFRILCLESVEMLLSAERSRQFVSHAIFHCPGQQLSSLAENLESCSAQLRSRKSIQDYSLQSEKRSINEAGMSRMMMYQCCSVLLFHTLLD